MFKSATILSLPVQNFFQFHCSDYLIFLLTKSKYRNILLDFLTLKKLQERLKRLETN